MVDHPSWQHEGRDWPNREASRFVMAGGLRWHVQVAGQGPDLVLVHGTAAATHSWRDVLPLLAKRRNVTSPAESISTSEPVSESGKRKSTLLRSTF